MTWIRRILLTFGASTSILIAIGAWFYSKGFSPDSARHAKEGGGKGLEGMEWRRLDRQREALRTFAASHGYNNKTAFFVDMSLPSGRYRFFVLDLEKDTVLLEGLVAHGCGKHDFAIHPDFSNTDGSGCSSLGRYRIGSAYNGRFGRAYKLFGLDSTNDQAFRRNIVLHSFPYVPESETFPLPICNSRGCPMVSPGFLKELEHLIDVSPRPVLLWIFN